MKVAIDARIIRHSGIGTHLRGLLEALARRPDTPEIVLLGPPALLDNEAEARPFTRLAWDAPIYGWREQATFPARRLREAGVTLVHSPHYNMPLRAGGLRRVVTIHDLIHLRFARHLSTAARLYARSMLGAVVRRADRLVTVSEHTRRDLSELLGVPPERVAVIPNAVGACFLTPPTPGQVASAKARLGLPPRYVLTVGINKPHKNYPFLARVMGRLWRESGDAIPPLVMAGVPVEENGAIVAAAGGGQGRLLFPGRVPWADIPSLYAGADLLVMPSLYEGFGLPLLEAQALGVPVAAARATSLPEVGGDATAWFDPRDADDAAAVLGDLLRDDARRAELAARGPANASRFSWDRSAEALVALYRGLAGA